jgi:hypothetical protein
LRHPQHRDLKNQAKSQHCNDQLTLLSPHHISFPIQRGIVFVIASRQFTVDSAKKKEFINIFLLMPESSVLNAMKHAKFAKEDIAYLRMRLFLQRALPGGSIEGLKAYIAGLNKRTSKRANKRANERANEQTSKRANMQTRERANKQTR